MINYHNDLARTGLNPNETILNPSNVNASTFGKLFTQTVDGHVYAQPLYVPHLSIAGGTHNVVFICTEHDSVYAFDADSAEGDNAAPLWQTNFLGTVGDTTVTTVPWAEVASCDDTAPEYGIMATPAIDLATNTLYVEAETKEVSAGPVTNYVHRLHALDLSTGAEKFGGPVSIAAVWTGPGGPITFNAPQQICRPGLMVLGGMVYTFWGSHCDDGLYYGWILRFNASDLSLQKVFNTAPTAQSGSIWQCGSPPAVDANGFLYLSTGNAAFDGGTQGVDYGDSLLKFSLAPSLLAVTDYFTPSNQAFLNANDEELGSVGPILLPDAYGSALHPHLLTAADKTGYIYLLDRDNLGGYQQGPGGSDAVVQEFQGSVATNAAAGYTMPAFYKGYVYWSFVGDFIKCYQIVNGLYQPTPSSQTAEYFTFPGCIPSVSSNGETNGILWAVQPGNPGVLRAYSAVDLGVELYNSTFAPGSRDDLGSPNNKFTPPTIINGKVYVPTANSMVVYGLLVTATPTPTATPSVTGSPVLTATPTPIENGPIVAVPNVLGPGQNLVTFEVLEPGATVEVVVYDVAGERIGEKQGSRGSSRCDWDATGMASGLYLARVTVIGADGSIRHQILKFLVIH
ncbi:MAG TPA: pyrrolo-quinoline quinone [bacterium]|nr:pyrrolo-quinoline quinone [bacterium]